MSASGSLETLHLAELLQVGALFRKMGSIRLLFPGQRAMVVYLHDGALSGLADSGRAWQLGDLLASLGLINSVDRQRLLTECTTRGKRLGQLVVEQGYLTKREVEIVLRRLMMQSLLYAAENEADATFEMHLGPVSQTSVMFPITDFLIELTSASDELDRLRRILGSTGRTLWVAAHGDETGTIRDLPYRKVQVLAHVDGQKSPMEVAATSPFSPTETLSILCELARSGVIDWVGHTPKPPLARVVTFPVAGRDSEKRTIAAAEAPETDVEAPERERREPGSVW
ncbi:MAG TPA: DUF4388 domain-containing protein [Thermoleophilia bacterium]|nr:DUF4388 domain-containing protein [Thermoleophilia bacterium]